MNIELLFWITIVVLVKSQQATKVYPQSQLISSGSYQIFVPIIQVYSTLTEEECKKIHGKPNVQPPRKFFKLIPKIMTMLNIHPKTLCKLHGKLLLNRNILHLSNGHLYQFDKGYCYEDGQTLLYWDITSELQFLTVFNGSLDLWEMQTLQPPTNFKIFSHKTLNLTLRIVNQQEMGGVNIFTTSIDELFIRSISNDTIEYIADDMIDDYFENLTNWTVPKNVNHQNEDSNHTKIVKKKCWTPKRNTTFSSTQICFSSRIVENFDTMIGIAAFVSLTGNCVGLIFMTIYCYKNVYINRINSSAATTSCLELKEGSCKENDLYKLSNENQS